jgi:hypothetical protein
MKARERHQNKVMNDRFITLEMQSRFALGRYSGVFDQTAESKIMNTIVLAGNKGITKNNLLSSSGVNQSTAYRITKMLEKKCQIRIIRKGQRTSYRILSDTRINIAYGSSILGRYAVRDLIEKSVPVISDEKYEKKLRNEPSCTEYREIVHKNTRYFEHKFKRNDEIGMEIFEFSVRIGAYITYLLINAMDPQNKLLADRKNLDRDSLAKDWINNAMSTAILSRLLWEFKDMIYKSIGLFPKGFEETVKYRNRKPRYILDVKTAKRVYSTFARLYPSINERLENITSDLALKVKSERDYEDEIIQKQEKG